MDEISIYGFEQQRLSQSPIATCLGILFPRVSLNLELRLKNIYATLVHWWCVVRNFRGQRGLTEGYLSLFGLSRQIWGRDEEGKDKGHKIIKRKNGK